MLATDLINAILIMGTFSCLAFVAGSRLRSGCKRLFLATICVALLIGFFVEGRLGWARILPHSSAIFLTNPLPIMVAFLAGFSTHVPAIRAKARPFTGWVLSVLSVWCLVSPLIRPVLAPPNVASKTEAEGFLILQSHQSTCAPASAASLLRFHGIDSNEADMIGPCLTSDFGTEALGLYRGISLGCQTSSLSPRLASRDPAKWTYCGQLPNVALVRFSDNEYAQALDIDPIKSSNSEPRWYTGRGPAESGHAVVVLGREGKKWRVADPAVGIVWWTEDELRRRFTGEAIFLSQR